ncbi:hypothetical protein [Longitalea luteola]|uniref:hypothetical protein n=1 Tax=Longitalea luteola TaxID=2812563 RepID=UPI001A972136|nr:hypothetical protein [Longitalea luteola]
MNDKAIVSTTTLVVSLIAYLYAKEAQKDAVPYMLVAGFIGSIVGETIVEKRNNPDK